MTPAQMRDEADWLFGQGLRKAPAMLRAAADEIERLEKSRDEYREALHQLLKAYHAERSGMLGGVQLDSEAMEDQRQKAEDVFEWAKKQQAAEAAAKAKEETQ